MLKRALDLIKKETDIEDVKLTLVSEFKNEDVSKILDAIEAAQKMIELDKLKTQKDQASKKESEINDIVAKAIEQKLDDTSIDKLADAVSKKIAPQQKTEFKSFLNEAVKVNDKNSWQQKMKEMMQAHNQKDFSTANEISAAFARESKLFDPELLEMVKTGKLNERQLKLLRGDATTGSYAVPDEFSDQVFAVAQRGSAIFDGATKMTMGSDKMYLLGSGDVTFTEVADQSTELTNSDPTLSQGYIDLIDAGAYSLVHNNLISDSNVNILQLISNAYGRGLAKYLKRSTAVGNVATTGDKINGIFSTTGIGSIAVLDDGGILCYDDLVNLEGEVDESFLDGCHFEMNRRELNKIRKIKDENGNPILVRPDSTFREYSILGYPVKLNNQMPITLDSTTGARTGGSTATILFGNPAEVQIGVKGGIVIAMSEHYKFTNRQTTIIGFTRWGQAVMNASAWARLTGIK